MRYLFKQGLFFLFSYFIFINVLQYIVTFTKVLTLYHSWIHPLHHSPLSASLIPGIVSACLIFPFTYMGTEYFHHIHLPSPFLYILTSPTKTHPPDRTCLAFLFSGALCLLGQQSTTWTSSRDLYCFICFSNSFLCLGTTLNHEPPTVPCSWYYKCVPLFLSHLFRWGGLLDILPGFALKHHLANPHLSVAEITGFPNHAWSKNYLLKWIYIFKITSSKIWCYIMNIRIILFS
jgi:hypothetical protein